MYAQGDLPAGTAATAEAVSCVAGAMTGAAKKRPEPFDLSIQIFFGEAF